ncbi:hypothetical protein [Eisenbergiella porci]|uniref:hypothetical protein n=1 Tax=Eisenbergiella porci TaxID=2652274 RepID=UPI002A7FA0F2|nr:hypothetical protein [Eisenbergiella porci]
MEKKLEIEELRTVSDRLPEDLVIEFSAGKESAANERILEYAKRIKGRRDD